MNESLSVTNVGSYAEVYNPNSKSRNEKPPRRPPDELEKPANRRTKKDSVSSPRESERDPLGADDPEGQRVDIEV
jgi:hypothetical protein